MNETTIETTVDISINEDLVIGIPIGEAVMELLKRASRFEAAKTIIRCDYHYPGDLLASFFDRHDKHIYTIGAVWNRQTKSFSYHS